MGSPTNVCGGVELSCGSYSFTIVWSLQCPWILFPNGCEKSLLNVSVMFEPIIINQVWIRPFYLFWYSIGFISELLWSHVCSCRLSHYLSPAGLEKIMTYKKQFFYWFILFKSEFAFKLMFFCFNFFFPNNAKWNPSFVLNIHYPRYLG